MSLSPVHTFTVGRFTVEIIPDYDAESPGDSEDKDGAFVVANHRDFAPRNPLNIRPADVRGDGDEDEGSGYAADYWIFPLFAYIHGGVSLSLGSFRCPWDSGQIGYLLLARSTWGNEPAAQAAAESTVAAWNQYLSGDVYGYRVLDEDGDCLDSCWGFYGQDDAESEGRAAAEYLERKAVVVDIGHRTFDPILFGA